MFFVDSSVSTRLIISVDIEVDERKIVFTESFVGAIVD